YTAADTSPRTSPSSEHPYIYSHAPTLIHQPQRSTLFPYTTLFRSRDEIRESRDRHPVACEDPRRGEPSVGGPERQEIPRDRVSRSEEHTSELQSPDHLVCRLLLEKKKE